MLSLLFASGVDFVVCVYSLSNLQQDAADEMITATPVYDRYGIRLLWPFGFFFSLFWALGPSFVSVSSHQAKCIIAYSLATALTYTRTHLHAHTNMHTTTRREQGREFSILVGGTLPSTQRCHADR